jgi:hypothetical protein
MQSNEAAMSDLLGEVMVYEGLIKEKLQMLQAPVGRQVDPHHDAICRFHEGIKGLRDVITDYSSHEKGFFQRAYNFCTSWCNAPENAQRIREYSEKITRAVNAMNYSGIVTLEQKADIMIAQGKELKKSLDQTLELFRSGGNSEAEFAQQISKLLNVGVEEVKKDLSANHTELRQIVGVGFNQMDQRLDVVNERLDALVNALRIQGDHPVPNLSDTIRTQEALEYWTKFFGQSQQVTLLEMRGVRSRHRRLPPPCAAPTPRAHRRRRRLSPGAFRSWRRRSPAP